MLDAQILTILACPACKEPLEVASSDLVTKIIQPMGIDVLSPIEGGLLCRKHNRFFAVRQGIPILLFNESILLP